MSYGYPSRSFLAARQRLLGQLRAAVLAHACVIADAARDPIGVPDLRPLIESVERLLQAERRGAA
jgi:hypothetical protein